MTLFKALADRTRLRILALLVGGEVCVCEIHGSLELPQPTVSRHLAYLRRARLVQTRRDGLWIHYRLASLDDTLLRTLTDIVTHVLGHVEAIARDADRLEKTLKKTLKKTRTSERPSCCVPAAASPRELTRLACCEEASAGA